MNELDPINQIDQMINRVKKQGDISAWKKDRKISPLLTLIDKLNKMPRITIPISGLTRVKNQIIDRISQEKPELVEAKKSFFFTITQVLPKSLKITGGIIAGFMIMVSLTVGVSVAALESVPGQPMYAVKKIVERTQLGLASDETEKTELQIKFAHNRLEELEKVLAKSNEGKLSEEATQKIVSKTVKDLQASTNAAVAGTQARKEKTTVSTLTKLAELSTKQESVLESATIKSEGEVKLELKKALEISRISKEEAISNIERAGLKIEGQPVILEEIPEKETEIQESPEPKEDL
jgi:hypothetical protein